MKNVIINNGKNVCNTNKYSLFILNIDRLCANNSVQN